MSVLLSGLIENKSLCETIPSPNEIAKQRGGGGGGGGGIEHKIAGFKKPTFISS